MALCFIKQIRRRVLASCLQRHHAAVAAKAEGARGGFGAPLPRKAADGCVEKRLARRDAGFCNGPAAGRVPVAGGCPVWRVVSSCHLQWEVHSQAFLPKSSPGLIIAVTSVPSCHLQWGAIAQSDSFAKGQPWQNHCCHF